MRFLILASLLSFTFACGDDSPMLSDTSTADTGRDTGADTGVDTGPTDTGVDARDTAMPDTGPPTCDPAASGITFPSREWNAEVVAEGAAVNEPVSMDWNAAGVMLFSNSVSWIGSGGAAGDVLEDDSGSIGVFAADDLMRGPAFVAWHPGVAMGFDEGLYMDIEDGQDVGMVDAVLKVAPDGSTVEVFATGVAEPGEMEFGPGNDFGDDLYLTSREHDTGAVPNPYEVYRVAADGSTTRYPIMDGSSEVNGAWTLEFGPGGDLGEDLYVGTHDDPGFSPGSMDAIYRVRASDGEANIFASGVRALGMAAPSLPAGDFGEMLYVVTANEILRLDRTGRPETFAEGIMSSAGVRFGPDGALYVAQAGAGRVIRISRCPAM